MIDDGEDEDDEENSYEHTPKTVHFGLVEEADTAMMAGKQGGEELSDVGLHDIGFSDAD